MDREKSRKRTLIDLNHAHSKSQPRVLHRERVALTRCLIAAPVDARSSGQGSNSFQTHRDQRRTVLEEEDLDPPHMRALYGVHRVRQADFC